MAQNYLVVVDVQNDFVTGALGSSEARAIVPGIVARARDFSGTVFLTRDTHYADYLSTREGQLLPVVHCVEGSEGWQFVPELEALRAARDFRVFDKETFGSAALEAWNLSGCVRTSALSATPCLPEALSPRRALS